MKKLVVFDWNGVLLSDTRACMDADNHILKTLGKKPTNLKQYREDFTIPIINFYIKHGCQKEVLLKNSKKIEKIFHSFFETRAAKCKTRTGGRKLLKWLDDNSIEAVILSNHTIAGIESQLNRLGIKKYITKVLANPTLETGFKKRYKIIRLKNYLKNKKYSPKEIVIIGDAPEEVEIGKKLGLTTVAITDGYYATHRLKTANPDYLINNLTELIDIIKNLTT